MTAATASVHRAVFSRRTHRDLCEVFRRNRKPIYFINSSAFNLLGAEEWIGNLTFVNARDSFDGRHPNAVVFGRDRPPGLDLTALNNFLLRGPAAADFFRRRGSSGTALFLMFDEETERLARGHGLDICFPPPSLRHRLASNLLATPPPPRARP